LDELGWLQFERLCALLVSRLAGVAPAAWRGSADHRRWLLLDDGVDTSRLVGAPSLGKGSVQVVWVRRGASDPGALTQLAEGAVLPHELGDVGGLVRIVMTNARLSTDELDDPSLNGVVVVDAHRIAVLVAEEPAAALRVPTLLGFGAEPAPPTASQDASFDVSGARALARVFVPTRAHERTIEVLERHHFAVVTGPPEMGKTAIARTVGLAVWSLGWQVHECIRPQQLWEHYDASVPQLFIADDAFGSTEYRPDASERWAGQLARAL
jgi:hypothetical protein